MALMPEQKHMIVDCIAQVLEVDPDQIHENTHFRDDLGADSLRAVEILVQLERGFKITIKQEALARMLTLQGVYDVVDELVGAEAARVG